jgi:hypothetical protein
MNHETTLFQGILHIYRLESLSSSPCRIGASITDWDAELLVSAALPVLRLAGFAAVVN